jgi:hypothetical protein
MAANDQQMKADEPEKSDASRRLLREFLILLGFVALTVLMTWPWVLHLRNAVPDEGDSYAHAYFLWWDYHQTIHDPLNLFHATIFYPYKYTLAFGESDYGISLFFFPLFALGFRPLTVYSVAAFLSFPFSGYGAFRLARTLSGSRVAAWVAGIVFAFLPYRFNQLSHLPILFAGWIPLLFEALVLFVRRRTWTRAGWLGLAFVMNALTCLAWFILTPIPLGLSAAILASRHKLWRDRGFWIRSGTSLCVASLVLLPFLLPYRYVAQLNGFGRSAAEVQTYSARPLNWLEAPPANKLWQSLGAPGADDDAEMTLFPGLLPVLLSLTAILLVRRKSDSNGYDETSNYFRGRHETLIKRVFALPRSEMLTHGVTWASLGFMGSFGLNFYFHRWLYQFVPPFGAVRVAARWAMVCYLGLALLAGLGVIQFAKLLNRRWPRLPISLTFCVLILAILFEQRVAPLPLVYGDADPDELAIYLKSKKMAGGIVELPAEKSGLFMLRAADHGHPLIDATNSFTPPIEQEIELLTSSQPIPGRFIDLLETIPASYLTVHNVLLSPERRLALEKCLNDGIDAGRVRFVRSFDGGSRHGIRERIDLYAVIKTEPDARTEGPRPSPLAYAGLEPIYSSLIADFEQTSSFIYRFYKASYDRKPHFPEFMPDAQLLKYDPNEAAGKLEDRKRAFAEGWVNRTDFKSKYDRLSDDQYVDTLLAQTGLTSTEGQRETLVQGLHQHTMSRAVVLRTIVDNSLFAEREFSSGLVLMHYFAYLKRDPDRVGYDFWLHLLNRIPNYRHFTEDFASSIERQTKLNQP